PPLGGKLTVGVATSRGKVRERNEDRYLVQQWSWCEGETPKEAALVVVADGMGGYQGGDRASALTVSVVARQLAGLLADAGGGPRPDPPSAAQLADAIDAALHESNRVVYEESA